MVSRVDVCFAEDLKNESEIEFNFDGTITVKNVVRLLTNISRRSHPRQVEEAK